MQAYKHDKIVHSIVASRARRNLTRQDMRHCDIHFGSISNMFNIPIPPCMGLSSQYDAHVRAARNSGRSPRSVAHTHDAYVASRRTRAVRAKCSLAGLTMHGTADDI